MGIFNYQEAYEMYKDDKFMLEILNCYTELDTYHLLRSCAHNNTDNFSFPLPCLANDYKKWLSVCDGGLLFSTILLSITEYDDELDLSFSTIQEMNSAEKRKLLNLPNGYMIIAVLNYGDPVCISGSDSKIYLWDTTESVFSTVWDSFTDFLADEYNTAIQMIEDNALEPVPLKVLEKQNGQ